MIVSELINILNTHDKNLTVVFPGADSTFKSPQESWLSTMIVSRTQEYMMARGTSGGEIPVVVLG